MFDFLVSALGVCLGLVAYADWRRTKDPFYPTMYLLPQLAFMYVFYPLYAATVDRALFEMVGGGLDELIWYQSAIIVFLLSLVIGIRVGSRRRQERASVVVPAKNESMLYAAAFVCAGTAIAAWVYMLGNVGGFGAAYGTAYGGGWADEGYVRETMYLGIVAVLLIMLARKDRGLRVIDWSAIMVAVAPILIQGLLGARRGPTFVVIATIGAGYLVLLRKKRISLITFLSAGFVTALLLLFLVANRQGIFLGSEKSLDAPLLSYLSPSYSNEYLYGSAIFRFVNSGLGFHGFRIVAHIVGHLIPSQIWPDKYSDLVHLFGLNINLRENVGIPDLSISSLVGWMPAVGAAPSMFGDFWLEFGVGSLAASFAVGWIYGRAWRLAKNDMSIQVVYLLLVGLSLYLSTQTIEAWLFRAILFGVPCWLAVRCFAYRIVAPPSNRTHLRISMNSRASEI